MLNQDLIVAPTQDQPPALCSPYALANLGLAHYVLKQYTRALPALQDSVSRVPKLREAHGSLAAAYAQLGRMEEARTAAAGVLRLQPNYTISGTSRRLFAFKDPKDAKHFFDGLRKAGLPE